MVILLSLAIGFSLSFLILRSIENKWNYGKYFPIEKWRLERYNRIGFFQEGDVLITNFEDGGCYIYRILDVSDYDSFYGVQYTIKIIADCTFQPRGCRWFTGDMEGEIVTRKISRYHTNFATLHDE